MTRAEAAEYAPQWGSYMTSGDTGACMYGLDSLGRPADAVSRNAIVAHIDSDCLPFAIEREATGDAEYIGDPDKLRALRSYVAAFDFPAPHVIGEPAQVNGVDVAEFLAGYVRCALWSSNDESDDSGGEPIDQNYDAADIAPSSMAEAEQDCRAFLHAVGHLITDDNFTGRADGTLAARAGNDFWLTRVGHGAGFWDGDWKSDDRHDDERPLSRAAGAAGECNPYIGDDGKVYLS
jgi:hypothetical protein